MSFRYQPSRSVVIAIILLVALAAACTGPDTGDDADPTPTPTVTPTATEIPPTETVAPTQTATPTVEPTKEPEATATIAASPTREASPEASPTVMTVELRDMLPEVAELPGEGYIVAEEGSRTAQELANAYADPAAHLQRLNEWGFQRHLFRAFSRSNTGDDNPLPTTILATINEYGSPEQADEAILWLRRLGTSQGATEVDPPPIGDNAAAITLPTAGGVPTASLYIRQGSNVFIYFAQGGDPLPAIVTTATNVFDR